MTKLLTKTIAKQYFNELKNTGSTVPMVNGEAQSSFIVGKEYYIKYRGLDYVVKARCAEHAPYHLRLICTINQPEYHYYVVDIRHNFILTGWELKSDAQEQLKENVEYDAERKEFLKIYTRQHLETKMGIKVDNDLQWSDKHLIQ